MSLRLRGLLRSRGRRLVVILTSLLVAAAIEVAHSVPSNQHVCEAAAMCFAVLAIAGAGVVAKPRLGRCLPPRPRALDFACPVARPIPATPPGPARGDPASFQVFRL
jgi:hypothetical protein